MSCGLASEQTESLKPEGASRLARLGRNTAPRVAALSVALGVVAVAGNHHAVSAMFGNVGSQNCQSCHAAAYTAWQAGPHVRSLDLLTAEQRDDARCLKCHAVAVDDGFEPVGCESCHGGGEHYVKLAVKRDHELARAAGLRDADESTCASCHTGHSPSLKSFDVKKGMEAIRHWDANKKKAPRDYTPVSTP